MKKLITLMLLLAFVSSCAMKQGFTVKKKKSSRMEWRKGCK